MFRLGRRSNEVLIKRDLERERMRIWTHMDDGRGCGVLSSEREVYLRTAVLCIYTPIITII
jgi:hypothetical protein